jgi:heavy metal sensor kinase
MAVGLVLATGALFWATSRTMKDQFTPRVEVDLALALATVVIAGTAATLVGAWWFTGWAVQPVSEITEQATRIEAGTLDQRIVAHADTDEYRDLVAMLNRMLERLERQFNAQRRLTADVGHELRHPLTALRGEIEVALRADRSPREYRNVLRSALEEIEHLTGMSEDLLLISRAEAHLLVLRPTQADVNAIVTRELDGLHAVVEEKDLTVDRSLAADRPATVDPALFARMVQHLLSNAVKFTPVGGRVSVATKSGPEGVRLSVQDSGPGIALADLPHVFEPFYRANSARTRGTGTGLGLAMVGAITRLHGGRIQASSADGGGARFELELPNGGSGSGPPG